MINHSSLQFLVGTSDEGEDIYGDFQRTGHFISSGHVGSGHASFDEGAFVAYMLQNYSHDELQFVMIDPKICQLTPYEGIPRLWRPLALTPEDPKTVVSDLLEEMERRFDLLSHASVKNILEYNAKVNDTEKLPFIILLGTEIADLMMIDGEFYTHALSMLAMKARAVGIHMYLATQRPSNDVLPDVILGLISGRLVFAVASEADSETLLGESGAEKITERGRLIFANYIDNEIKFVNAHYVSDDEIMKIVEKVKTNN
jgi:S-DNA-T family DNA segregation ATPase FtsK/SpoIIIE